ncbi:MAG TPA: ferrochelatase [Candidatus Acidoferrum sp.]|nr:ferrochelatase [Candidatus Acidoferrum sp.]
MAGKKRVGVVLFQLGGPDSLDAVEPFLRNLFLDPDIIPMGPLGFLRGPLARYIAKKRSIPVRGRYAMIGRRSPIAILTERQRAKLAIALSPYVDPVVVTAMRYWKPFTEDAAAALKAAGLLDDIVLLPLYPHYSYATTLSSLKEWRRVYGSPAGGPPEHTVENFYNHPAYIEALVRKIGVCLRQFPDSSRIHLLFSAHGIPISLVKKGDPYPGHIAETVRLVSEAGPKRFANWPRTHVLCFQSRVGPTKWLEPPFLQTMERLGHEGVKEMLVVPISFVTEHIETLHEINIDGRMDAKKWGIERFRMMPAVGDSAPFIEALKDVTLKALHIANETRELRATG